MFSPRFVIRAFSGETAPHMSNAVLRILLDALTAIDIVEQRAALDGGCPLPPLYQSGIVYVRDPPLYESTDVRGPEDWQDAIEILKRREGDCKSLACYRAAELHVRYGIAAFAQFRWKDRDPGSLYHIVVQHPDGRIEDPSAKLGMGKVPYLCPSRLSFSSAPRSQESRRLSLIRTRRFGTTGLTIRHGWTSGLSFFTRITSIWRWQAWR